ncbi:hypothetical protein HOT82_gp125 [Gordonia phage Ronaldo]|uniref:Uncharacterized protein n=3 Tax=Ronaldovirus ronaldo TaxID=2734270 RepID=A0A6B9LEK6_9CAUD|nr:hypothetical protein HOT82_gp125 [Gordonia phage Ronaldo]AXN53687.1 hypothetical protein SEA_RONALDO_125 [Gordonia phage Ronaldo]QDH48464.1 hypothetical protein SEA_ZIKO_126 [Gordonia phage Ziko]QHB38241.1 hypothetical protein SEA_VOLT_128 [Gordonia phage Volt]QTF81911.1 hypothetical protein SEA_GUEY18_128 [Gordonia phage Guey18]
MNGLSVFGSSPTVATTRPCSPIGRGTRSRDETIAANLITPNPTRQIDCRAYTLNNAGSNPAPGTKAFVL